MFTRTRITLSAAVAGLLLCATAAVTYAAPRSDANAQVAKPAVVALADRRVAERPTSTAPLSMLVEDPAGNRVRLTHVPGSGWKYESGKRAASMLRQTALQAAPAPSSDGDASTSLTVFIDGPSGFTYVWNRDKGWTFIGKLVDDVL
jgi:hypothetical protein